MKRGKLVLLMVGILSIFLIAGCANQFVTKECLYKQDGTWVSMGVLCNEGINTCVSIKDNIDKFKSVDTENIMCAGTKLRKIVNSGNFVNCVTSDDCYTVLSFEKPFSEFNVLVCEDEFCKTTMNYNNELVKVIKTLQPVEESTEIPLAPVEDNNASEEETIITSTEGLSISPTGCGDTICMQDSVENCATCIADCGCRSSTYCDDKLSVPVCKKLTNSSS